MNEVKIEIVDLGDSQYAIRRTLIAGEHEYFHDVDLSGEEYNVRRTLITGEHEYLPTVNHDEICWKQVPSYFSAKKALRIYNELTAPVITPEDLEIEIAQDILSGDDETESTVDTSDTTKKAMDQEDLDILDYFRKKSPPYSGGVKSSDPLWWDQHIRDNAGIGTGPYTWGSNQILPNILIKKGVSDE